MRGTPKEAKAAERELGRTPRPKLRDRPTPPSDEQPFDPRRPSRSQLDSCPAPQRAEEGPKNDRIIPLERGGSNGNPTRFTHQIEARGAVEQRVPGRSVGGRLSPHGEQPLVHLRNPFPEHRQKPGPDP